MAASNYHEGDHVIIAYHHNPKLIGRKAKILGVKKGPRGLYYRALCDMQIFAGTDASFKAIEPEIKKEIHEEMFKEE